MARKKQAVIKADSAAVAATGSGEDDLQILHPERLATIAGRQVVVREYGFVEGLRLQGQFLPFADDLYACMKDTRSAELNEIIELIGRHADLVTELIAISADVEVDWVRRLNDTDGSNLLFLWWAVNAPFFVRRVFGRLSADLALAAQRVGATSMPSSSSMDTAPQQ